MAVDGWWLPRREHLRTTEAWLGLENVIMHNMRPEIPETIHWLEELRVPSVPAPENLDDASAGTSTEATEGSVTTGEHMIQVFGISAGPQLPATNGLPCAHCHRALLDNDTVMTYCSLRACAGRGDMKN